MRTYLVISVLSVFFAAGSLSALAQEESEEGQDTGSVAQETAPAMRR